MVCVFMEFGMCGVGGWGCWWVGGLLVKCGDGSGSRSGRQRIYFYISPAKQKRNSSTERNKKRVVERNKNELGIDALRVYMIFYIKSHGSLVRDSY